MLSSTKLSQICTRGIGSDKLARLGAAEHVAQSWICWGRARATGHTPRHFGRGETPVEFFIFFFRKVDLTMPVRTVSRPVQAGLVSGLALRLEVTISENWLLYFVASVWCSLEKNWEKLAKFCDHYTTSYACLGILGPPCISSLLRNSMTILPEMSAFASRSRLLKNE